MKKRDDYGRLHAYVERFFARSGNTTFPTVKQAAKAMGLKQAEVFEVVEEHSGVMFLTSYFTDPPQRIGEYYINSDEPVEKQKKGG